MGPVNHLPALLGSEAQWTGFMGHGCCASPGSQFAGIRNKIELLVFPQCPSPFPVTHVCVEGWGGDRRCSSCPDWPWQKQRAWEGQPGPGGTQRAMISRVWVLCSSSPTGNWLLWCGQSYGQDGLWPWALVSLWSTSEIGAQADGLYTGSCPGKGSASSSGFPLVSCNLFYLAEEDAVWIPTTL